MVKIYTSKKKQVSLQLKSDAPQSNLSNTIGIQRKIFIQESEQQQPKKGVSNPTTENNEIYIPSEEQKIGDGDKKIENLMRDRRSRYFKDQKELEDYAQGKTDDIGYVEREKTWVRLPENLLVLGERHDETTLMDLVKATGNNNYMHERGRKPLEYKSKMETSSGNDQQEDNPKALEPTLPKMAFAFLFRLKGIKEKIEKREQNTPDTSEEQGKIPQDLDQKYEEDLADWSQKWENTYQDSQARLNAHQPQSIDYGGRIPWDRNLTTSEDLKLPNRPHQASTTGILVGLEIMSKLNVEKSSNLYSIQQYYQQNQKIVDKTLEKLKQGTTFENTEMYTDMYIDMYIKMKEKIKSQTPKKMKFSPPEPSDTKTSQLWKLFEMAAINEFNSKPPEYDVTKEEKFKGYKNLPIYGIRDSYILSSILNAANRGIRIIGIGDFHRYVLEEIIQDKNAEIIVKQTYKWYQEQYQKHPDRD